MEALNSVKKHEARLRRDFLHKAHDHDQPKPRNGVPPGLAGSEHVQLSATARKLIEMHCFGQLPVKGDRSWEFRQRPPLIIFLIAIVEIRPASSSP
jgi:hypothetical protein